MSFGALILTGGASRRMGEDKARLDWAGKSAIARVIELASHVGAARILAVGAGEYGMPTVSEDPPGGGPVAGLVAGAAALKASGCDRALVLAVDAPTIDVADLAPLLDAAAPGVSFAHLHIPLLLWLGALPSGAGAGWSMGRLLTEMQLPLIEPAPEAVRRLRGANTPDERAALLDDLLAREAAQKDGAG